MYHVSIHVILFQGVNKFPFPNKPALKYIHTFVNRTSMTAFDHISIVKANCLFTVPKV